MFSFNVFFVVVNDYCIMYYALDGRLKKKKVQIEVGLNFDRVKKYSMHLYNFMVFCTDLS